METVSISKKVIVVLILTALAFFGLGYLYRGQDQQAPIIIEKKSSEEIE